MGKRLKKVAVGVGCGLVAALALGAVLQAALSYWTARSPPPGRLIDVGGHALHLVCRGEGGPAVILEHGLPGSALAWAAVTAEAARISRVCAYDRAGYGWSEPGPPPRTAGAIVDELKALLQNAGVEPPYVLVGHSFGGLLMQLYAGRYPEDVAGMVLVDASHPQQISQTTELNTAVRMGRAVRILAPVGIPRFVFPVPAGSPESRDASVRALERRQLKSTKTLRAVASELSGLPQSLAAARDNPPRLGQKPLVVLTEGRRNAKFWQEMQEDLTRLSTDSEWRIVEGAGHHIQHDRPQAVVSAISNVVEAVRVGSAPM